MPTTTDPSNLAQEIAAAIVAGKDPAPETLAAYRAATTPKRPAGRTPLRNFRASDDLWARVTTEAERRELTPSEILRTLIEAGLPVA